MINLTKNEHRCLFLMTYYNSEIKRKKINIAEKKKNYIKNYSEMSIDALIERIQPKFIRNFY